MDPQTRIEKETMQKEIWDARVKIVMGRFIINAIYFLFAYAFLGMVIHWQSDVFYGDAFFRPYMLFGLVVAFIIMAIGFILNYQPKQKKLNLFIEHLTLYKAKEKDIMFGPEPVIAKCFNSAPGYELKADIAYHCWTGKDNLHFFPVKPDIADIDLYFERKVPYILVSIPFDVIETYSPSGNKTHAIHTYDQKKKLSIRTVTSETVVLHVGDASQGISFERPVMDLLDRMQAGKKIETSTKTAPLMSKPVEQSDDIEAKLEKLKKLHDAGLITDEEYGEQRKRIISRL